MLRKIFVALTICSLIFFTGCGGEENSDEPENIPEAPTAEETVEEKPLFEDTPAKVAQYLNDGPEYAVYLAFPKKSSEAFIYNSKQMRSASMIKVFIMAAVMEKVKQGELTLDEPIPLNAYDIVGGAGVIAGYGPGMSFPLRDVMELMITYSDNTATNMIIDRIGGEVINDYMRRNGYSDSFLGRKMMYHTALAGNGENYSSVRDLGIFFTRLYNHQCVDEKLDQIMIDILLKQTDIDCFPAALPDKKVSHKTGALDDVYDDGGIIYSKNGDAVLVIMTENFTGGEFLTIQHMKNFTRAVID